MDKKQLLTTLTVSTLVLTQASLVHADEVTPIDPTAPSTEVVPPSEPATPEAQPTEPSEVTPTPVDPTAPSTDETAPSTDAEAKNEGDTQTKPGTSDSTDSKDKDDKGESNSTEQPKPTEEPSKQPDKPKGGNVSGSIGQVVSTVTPEAPVQTNTGASIVDTKDGNVVLSDGSVVAPEAVGGVTNADKTITVTKADGTKVTLPQTGESTGILSLLGAALLAGLRFILKKEA